MGHGRAVPRFTRVLRAWKRPKFVVGVDLLASAICSVLALDVT